MWNFAFKELLYNMPLFVFGKFASQTVIIDEALKSCNEY